MLSTINETYDIVVLGCGGIGSATLYSAAKTGLKTLGIEQYQRGHKNGGTHGETRTFRLAYYDNSKYIPLLKKAYSNWIRKRRNDCRCISMCKRT